jgi:hypothetical protein
VHRSGKALGRARTRKACVALPHVPAVVAAPLDDGHFFPLVLAHVADPKRVEFTIEAEAPGVAQTDGVDLGSTAAVDVGVVRRDAVGRGRRRAIDVDAQDRAEQGVRILTVAVRIAAITAVTHADVEEPVRPEHEPSAVVVGVRLGNRQ